MSLKTRFLLATILGNALVLAILTTVLILQERERHQRVHENQAVLLHQNLQDWFQPAFAPREESDIYESRLDRIEFRLNRNSQFPTWYLFNPAGDLVRAAGTPSSPPSRDQKILNRAIEENQPLVRNNRLYTPLMTREGTSYGLIAEVSLLEHPAFQFQSALVPTLLIMGLGTVLLVIILYLIYEYLLFNPLSELLELTEDVQNQNYDRRLEIPDRNDEIKELFAAFNDMLEQLSSYRDDMEQRVEEARKKFRETRQSLLLAQRLSSMGTLASGIAHEINNPLSGLMNAVDTLRRSNPSPEKRKEYLALIEDGLERIQQIVNQVLEFSPSRNQVEIEQISLNEMLSKSMDLVQYRTRNSNIKFETDFPDVTVDVEGGPSELQQAFMNLLSNALEACEEAEQPEIHTITVRLEKRNEKNQAFIEIDDTGIGMTDEQQEKAFDLFYSSRKSEEGSGLGLSISHQIIRNHGGSMTLTSNPGEGTTVEIRLPLELDDDLSDRPFPSFSHPDLE